MESTPIRSMTGFGEAEQSFPEGRVTASVRTVNHRNLNLHLRVPAGLERHQGAMEDVLRKRFIRGHVTAGVTVERDPEAGVMPGIGPDMERARGYVTALRTLQEAFSLSGDIPIEVLAGFRDIFRDAEVEEALPEVSLELLAEVLAEAANRVVSMREQEGARLVRDLSNRLDALDGSVASVEEMAPRRLIAERNRMRDAIQSLLGEELRVDEERLAREVAHLAERWDIHEEVVRFHSHLSMFRETLNGGGEGGVGKRLGFISQELLREANTIGSKANDAGIAREVVLLKEEIEKLREQLENVE